MTAADPATQPRTEITLPDGPWLDRLDPSFLARTYPAWASSVSSMDDAARAFRLHGFAQMAALGVDLAFDPAYYAETNPAWQHAHDLERYRNWLLEGIATDRPGSPAAHLRKLGLFLDAYPAAFPWEYYARMRPSAGAHRWAALDDFCRGGFGAVANRLRFDAAAAGFLLAVGRMYSQKDDRLAVHAYELVRLLTSLSSVEEQHLADAYLRLGLWRPALELYRGIVHAAKENAWTIRNLVRCAAPLEQWDALRADIHAARPRLTGLPLWEEAAFDTIDAIFQGEECRARAMMAEGRYADAERILMDAASDLSALIAELVPPPPRRAPAERGKILFLANLDDPARAERRVREKLPLLQHLGLAHHVVPFLAPEQFMAELSDATAVVLFRVPALPAVLRCIAAARQLGIPTYYESDEALADADTAAPLADSRGLLTAAVYDDVRFGLPLYRAAARLCDFGVAPTGRIGETFRRLVSKRVVFVLRDVFPFTSPAPAAEADAGGQPIRLFLRVHTLTFLDADAGTVGYELLALLQERREIELCVYGPLHLDRQFDMLGDRVRHLPHSDVPRAYRAQLANCHINLLPHCVTADEEYHAEIGWAEAAEDLLPSIAFLPRGAMPELRDDQNIARRDDAATWAAAVRRLADDPELRRRLALQAREDAAVLHSGEQAGRTLEMALAAGRTVGRQA